MAEHKNRRSTSVDRSYHATRPSEPPSATSHSWPVAPGSITEAFRIWEQGLNWVEEDAPRLAARDTESPPESPNE